MLRKLLWTIFFGFVLLHASVLLAEQKQYSLISTEELKEMIDKSGEELTIVDARGPSEYQEVHIKNAINVPVNDFEQNVGLLPADKTKQIIFYCNGVKCGKSKKAAEKALEAGYENVVVYAEGMPVWEEKGMPIYAGPDYEKKVETSIISPEQLKELVESKKDDFTVVDVRDEEEFRQGHIPGAMNIPSEVFATNSGVLDKNKTIVVYCNSGGRSYNAYRKLMKLSYKNIRQAIFSDWKDAGFTVQSM
ncbi:MAG: rhodanese-like domain-containing protein [Desulfobulbaceae bacterium]|nr:rhodanese-like domain-containing protein [Desulfobulbaceae bacterium]